MRTRDLDKQLRIKKAMVSLILKEGIDGLSMSKIAAEAGVSPATIYVYYDSKEDMLAEVFSEYSRQSYYYLMQRLNDQMSAADLIAAIVEGIYDYSRENEEIFSFVEQCSCCPGIQNTVCQSDCSLAIFDLIHQYQRRGEVRYYSDENLSAVLFSPVRYLVINHRTCERNELEELIEMMQRMLLL